MTEEIKHVSEIQINDYATLSRNGKSCLIKITDKGQNLFLKFNLIRGEIPTGKNSAIYLYHYLPQGSLNLNLFQLQRQSAEEVSTWLIRLIKELNVGDFIKIKRKSLRAIGIIIEKDETRYSPSISVKIVDGNKKVLQETFGRYTYLNYNNSFRYNIIHQASVSSKKIELESMSREEGVALLI